MVKVDDLLKDIQGSVKQVSSSQKDEVRIMQATMNDTSYEVGVYSNAGKIGTYNPAQDFRAMQAGTIATVAKISKDEATNLLKEHEFTKSDATTMVNMSKEFVNTYLSTGRKLPFGGREDSNFALAEKQIPKTVKTYQKRTVAADGTVSWEPGTKTIPAHKGLKARSSCPSWVKAE